MTDDRRKAISSLLKEIQSPITGSELAKRFDVSRQVIVQDIALLRASGMDIVASSNGYYLNEIESIESQIRTLVCKHEGYDTIEDELGIIIDMGGKVLNVIIDHPVYGDITCPLNISSRHEIKQFVEKVRNSQAAPLASLTDGEHIHTIEVPSDEVFEIMKRQLRSKGILVED